MSIAIPFGSPLYVMLKPVGSRCNLACNYCYYLEKGKRYPGQASLSEELIETFIRQYIEAQTMPEVLFTWHGGEPLLQPLKPMAPCSLTSGVSSCVRTASWWVSPSTDLKRITMLIAAVLSKR